MSARGRSSAAANLDVARRAARAGAREGARALARVEERARTRWVADTRNEAAQGSAERERLLALRVEGPRGIGSAELVLGAEAPGDRALEALARAARAGAGSARDGGTLAGALAGVPDGLADRDDPASLELSPHAVWPAVSAGIGDALAGRDAAIEAVIGLKLDATRLAIARAGGGEPERVCARSGLVVAVEGELRVQVEGSDTASGGSFQASGAPRIAQDLGTFVAAVGEQSRAAVERAVGRSRAPHPLPKTAQLTLLAPSVLTWIVHGPIVDGLGAARAGDRAALPSWLAVEDASDDASSWPDEQGLAPSREPLVAGGRWLRGPFRPFDGTGRTRRDETGEAKVAFAGLVARVDGAARGFVQSRRELERRAEVALVELASADPLPSGGVAIVAHAAVRAGRRWAPAGLARVRVRGSELWRRAVAASAELERTQAQELPVYLPSLLVEGLRLRDAR